MKKIFGLLLLAAFIVGSYFLINRPTEKYHGSVEKLRFCTSTTDLTSAPIFVANAKNYFKENGLDIQFSYRSAGKFCLQDLVDKKADVATLAIFPFVAESFDNPNIKILASLANSEKDIQMVTKKSIISKPADLKGKKIGVTTGTDAHFFLDSFLIFNNMNSSDVTVINVKPEALPDALVTGKVDAIITWQPNIAHAEKALGNDALVWQAQNHQYWAWLLVSRQDVISDKTEAMKRLLKALSEGQDYMQSNPRESKQIAAKQTQTDFSYVDSLWSDYNYSLQLPQEMLPALEDEARWAIENKFTQATKVPNYLDFIYFDALEAVKPEEITITH